MTGDTTKFKVVATDTHLFPLREELEVLGALDCTVVSAVCQTEDETIAACRDAHVVLDTNAKITRRVIGELREVLAVCRYGVGVDTVDLPAATEHGIIVANVPDFCFDEVADTAMSLILSVPRKVHLLNAMNKRQSLSTENAKSNFTGITSQGHWADEPAAKEPKEDSMKVRINKQCMGDRNCNKLCPEVFEYDEDQLLAIVKFDVIPEQYHELVRRAAQECLPQAIEIEE